MEKNRKNMDDLIKKQQFFHYRYWDAVAGPEFQVRGIGGEELMPPGMVLRRQGTPDWMLMLYTPGTRVKFRGEWLDIKEDTLCIFPPGSEHHYGCENSVWNHSWMHICGTVVDVLMEKYANLQNMPLSFSHRAFLRHLDYMAGEFRLRRKNSWIVCRNTLEHLLLELADDDCRKEYIPERMLKVREYMERNYLKTLSLKELAKHIAVSVPLLSLEFKKSFGTSPGACLQDIRLRHALYYLGDLNLSIEEVAKRCGFADPFYFSRLFRRKYGVSPREYRKK